MSDKRKYHAYYRNVMSGSLDKTPGGLTKDNIKVIHNRNKKGSPVRYVSMLKHENGKNNIWANAVKEARKQLGLTGFVPINGVIKTGHGKPTDGKDLYETACGIYNNGSEGCKKKFSSTRFVEMDDGWYQRRNLANPH